MPVLQRKHVTLSHTASEQVADLRDALLRRSRDALRAVAPSVRRDAERAIDAIVASGYDDVVIKREVNALVSGHYRRVREEVAAAIQDAAGLVDRYERYTRAWEIEQRRKLTDVPGQFIAPSRVAHGMAYGEAQTAAAMAGQVADIPVRRFVPRTPADKLAARELLPWRDTRSLSERLHSSQINARRDAIRLSMRAVREGRALQANNDLILDLAKKGHRVGGADELPQYLQRFERAGNRLMEMQRPSPRDAQAMREYKRRLADWRTQRRAVRRYASRLAEGGRVQNALVEVLQRTSRDNPRRLRGAMDVFLNQRQSYNAERILDTEIHASYRSAQYQRDRTNPAIIGYIWRLQRDARRDFARRTKPRRIKLRSGRRTRRARRCICESMNGRRLSKDALANYPQGGHPHCMCWFEPVYDRRKLASAPVTAEEDRWYQEEFGG